MQQCLQMGAGARAGLPLSGLPFSGAALRHRALLLIGPRGSSRRGARLGGPLARRVLDRLIAPAAQVEGVDLHLADGALVERARGAEAFVLVLPPLGNLSNSFYRVHPRRNDRFVAARSPLRALFPEVDFAPFAFTGHALGTLAATCPERFALVRRALEQAWSLRMRLLLDRLPQRGVLIELPTPEWLTRPSAIPSVIPRAIAAVDPIERRVPSSALVVRTRILTLDPDDRASAAEALRAALVTHTA